jgi:heme-degrading monooxygenase HmoA
VAGVIAQTPAPPYVAVIFTSVRAEADAAQAAAYAATSARMLELAARQPGYLGVESARDGVGITVSYWRDAGAARDWKAVAEHLVAQRHGRREWYRDYRVRVAVVERDYGPGS